MDNNLMVQYIVYDLIARVFGVIILTAVVVLIAASLRRGSMATLERVAERQQSDARILQELAEMQRALTAGQARLVEFMERLTDAVSSNRHKIDDLHRWQEIKIERAVSNGARSSNIKIQRDAYIGGDAVGGEKR